MRILLILVLSLVYAFSTFGQKTLHDSVSNALNNKKCKLKGIIYRDLKEIDGLDDFQDLAGSLIGEVEKNDYRGIEIYGSKKKCVIVFDSCNHNGDLCRYKIIDTLNIILRDEKEYVASLGYCKASSYPNSVILAVIKELNKKGDKYKVIKAWYVDLNLDTIIPIANLKSIECITQTQLGDAAE